MPAYFNLIPFHPIGVPRRHADGQTGQADYSEQWIEYYRSMGMDKEAEAIKTARVSQILFRALYSNSGICILDIGHTQTINSV